jgi:acetyl esterase
MTKKMISIAFAALSAIFLAACESSDSPESDAAFEAALENANQELISNSLPGADGVAPMGAPLGMGPPPGMGGPPGAPGGPPPQGQTLAGEPDQILTYKEVEGIALQAHIFNPEGTSDARGSAALVFLHGGGLRQGSPAQGYEFAERFSAEGLAVVSIQYRLLGTNAETLDQLVADGKSAIRWLRENSDELGIDPDRIAMMGHSAGASLTLTTSVVPAFDEESENAEISSMPNAIVAWSPTITRSDDPENSIVAEGMLMEDLSPASYVREGLPTALFIHGDLDPIASPEAAVKFEARYRAAGNESSFLMIEGADHFFRPPEHRDQLMVTISDFLAGLGYSNR